jgi:hypothetical protein
MTFLSAAPERLRCKPLAACIAALCGLSASNALAVGNTWNVTACGDTGPGTLRATISTPTTLSGDIVSLDMLDSLACSTITLAADHTSITILQNDLTIKKSGTPVTIDASALPSGETNTDDSRIFTHKGTSTLRIQNVNLTGGHVYHLNVEARGGCVRSSGTIELTDSVVSACSATSKAAAGGKFAFGGALDSPQGITLTNSTVAGSSATSANFRAYGGGIHAQGTVTLTNSTVSGNSLTAAVFSSGGGISSDNLIATHAVISNNYSKAFVVYGGGTAGASIQLNYSSVTGNTAKSLDGAWGGGIYSTDVIAHYSTISGNSLLGSSGYGAGGAIYAKGDVELRKSTIANNYSSAAIGGIASLFLSGANTNQFYMIASTVTGNVAASIGGGIATNAAQTKLYNSTVAFNRATDAFAHGSAYAPGLILNSLIGPMAVTLSSNLLSNNSYGAGIEFDLSTANSSPPHAITFNAGAANNFIRTFVVGDPPASQLPGDTLSGACPLLGPLRDNGGTTLTHALLSGSVAIDHGNNARGLLQDQRGLEAASMPYPYPRVSNLVADIGAYEVNHADIVFNGGFDGCPALPGG